MSSATAPATDVRQFTVHADDDGIRLDRWFKRHLTDVSFGQVSRWARTGQLRVDGARATPGDRIAADGSVRSRGRNLYDFTFSAPKSVSVVAELGGDNRLVEAHRQAVAAALRELESLAATCVRRAGASHDRTTGNLVLAVYHHDTSLELDPQLQQPAGRDAHLVLVPNPPQHPAGDFGLERGVAVAESGVRYTFSGLAVYRPEFFAGCVDGAFPLKPLLLRSMSAGRCSAELYGGVWQDVGTVDRLEALNAAASAP